MMTAVLSLLMTLQRWRVRVPYSSSNPGRAASAGGAAVHSTATDAAREDGPVALGRARGPLARNGERRLSSSSRRPSSPGTDGASGYGGSGRDARPSASTSACWVERWRTQTGGGALCSARNSVRATIRTDLPIVHFAARWGGMVADLNNGQ
jgi:hypothetical protein